MALESCVAFLLADEFDAEELAPFELSLKARGIGEDKVRSSIFKDNDDDYDDDDDDDEGDEGSSNSFSATVSSLSVLDFQRYFQLTQPQVEELVTLLSPCHWASRQLEGWSVMHAVLLSLWTLSTQEPHGSIAARFHTSEALVLLHLNDFCSLIAGNFADQIRWPKWKEAEASVAGFLTDVGLPGTVCALGSCTVPIDRPADVADPEAYRDLHENSYSLTLLAFCNNQGCFTFVSAEHPGSWPDSRVLFETQVGKALRDDPQNLLQGKHVIADATFPLSEYLLTLFPDYGTLGEKKLRYNLRVRAALRVVQGSLSVLRFRFQRLRGLRMGSVGRSALAVKTCCILYNMYLETNNAASVHGPEERTRVQVPFCELPYGHSGSIGGISKRQDVAASLGRKAKKTVTNISYHA